MPINGRIFESKRNYLSGKIVYICIVSNHSNYVIRSRINHKKFDHNRTIFLDSCLNTDNELHILLAGFYFALVWIHMHISLAHRLTTTGLLYLADVRTLGSSYIISSVFNHTFVEFRSIFQYLLVLLINNLTIRDLLLSRTSNHN